MIKRNLARRLEYLEDSLLPVIEERLVLRIISVSANGERVDTGIEFKVPAWPEADQEEVAVKAMSGMAVSGASCRPRHLYKYLQNQRRNRAILGEIG